MAPQTNPILTVAEREGRKLKMAGGEYRIVVSGKQTEGAFAVIEMTVPPGAGPNPHSHSEFVETFYVLEGAVTFKSEEGSYIATQNSLITIPKGGKIHGFKNHAAVPAKLLCTVIPAGLDAFFEEVSDFLETNATASNPIDPNEKIKALSEKYGQQLYPEDYLD